MLYTLFKTLPRYPEIQRFDESFVAGLKRGIARHAARAASPDGGAGHGNLNHRRLSRRRRHPDQQERLPLPARLRPGPARPLAAAQAHGTGPARPAFAGLPDFLNKLESVKPRDQGWAAHADVANAEQGVWGCTLVGYCTEVFPRGVDPAHAINQHKVNSTLDYVGLALPLQPKGARK